MFCKNCGEPIVSEQAVVCVKCGTAKGQGTNFCANCGRPVAPGATVCMNCGVTNTNTTTGDKSKLVAGLLAIFLGCFGVHNFYLGYTAKAVIQLVATIIGLLTSCLIVGYFVVLGISIWALVEGIMILCGKIDTDGKGNRLTE